MSEKDGVSKMFAVREEEEYAKLVVPTHSESERQPLRKGQAREVFTRANYRVARLGHKEGKMLVFTDIYLAEEVATGFEFPINLHGFSPVEHDTEIMRALEADGRRIIEEGMGITVLKDVSGKKHSRQDQRRDRGRRHGRRHQ